jgi:hypothetical protein
LNVVRNIVGIKSVRSQNRDLTNKIKRETIPFFPIFFIDNFSVIDNIYTRINSSIGGIENFKKK